ncbi:MAG TPA: SDR family oxidoreductase [Candidatus Nanopelagicales bacterium]
MILVTGANGNIGSAVVPDLLDRGVPVRVLVRDTAKAQKAFGDRVEIIEGDLSDTASVQSALDGVEKVFLNTPSLDGFIDLQRPLIDAAARAGVAHLVRISVMGADLTSPISYARGHAALDAHLASTDLPWTVLAPSGYFQNLLSSAESIRQGAIYGSAGDGAVGFIDTRDIAAVAAAILTGDGHEGQTHVLTGGRAITYSEIAAAFQSELGHDVAYIDVPPEAFGENLRGFGLPDSQVTDILALFEVFKAGYAATVTPDVAQLLGRQPRTIADFAHDYRTVVS